MHSLLQLAYIDPSTGSLLIQAIIGAVAGIGVFGRRSVAAVMHRIRALFGKKD